MLRFLSIIFTASVFLFTLPALSFSATFTVGTTEDQNNPITDCVAGGGLPNDCSLREAILSANKLGAKSHTINLPAGTYKLTLTGAEEDLGKTGDLDVLSFITILGAGQDLTIIDGMGTDRVFHVMSGGKVLPTLRLRKLTVTGGGGVEKGGGIYYNSASKSSLNNVSVLDNTASVVIPGSKGQYVYGGGIYMEGKTALSIQDSLISSNKAYSTHATSRALAYGGGITVHAGASLKISNSTISNNKAQATGNSYSFAAGGGVYMLQKSGQLFMSNTTITGNTALAQGDDQVAAEGGGLYVGSSMFAASSTIDTNTASAISNNGVTSQGGGIFSSAGGYSAENITVSGNKANAQTKNPAVKPSAGGGGIYMTKSGKNTLSQSTVVNNSTTATGGTTPDKSGGGTAVYFASFGPLNTIIANNTPINCTSNQLTSGKSSNMTSDKSCPFIYQDTVPLLGPLADNGGFTKTHALSANSPALDLVAKGGLLIDQRGVARPQGVAGDLGSYEYIPNPVKPLFTKTVAYNGSIATYTITATNTGTEPLSNVEITDPAPYPPTNISGNIQWMLNGNTIIAPWGTFHPADTLTLVFDVEVPPTGCLAVNNTAYLQTSELPLIPATADFTTPGCDTGTYEPPFDAPYKRNVPGNDPDVDNTGWTNGGSFIEGHNWGGLTTPISYTFTGSRIDVRANLGPLFGKVKIYIDDVFAGEIDLFSTDPLTNQVIFSTLVGAGQHTIEIVPVASPPGITVQITGFTVYR